MNHAEDAGCKFFSERFFIHVVFLQLGAMLGSQLLQGTQGWGEEAKAAGSLLSSILVNLGSE